MRILKEDLPYTTDASLIKQPFIIKDMAFFLIQNHPNLILKTYVCLDGVAWSFFLLVGFLAGKSN